MGGGSKRWKEKKGSHKEVEKVEGRGAKRKRRGIQKKGEDIRENSWEGGEKIKIKKKKRGDRREKVGGERKKRRGKEEEKKEG